jgi:hypothetical protein
MTTTGFGDDDDDEDEKDLNPSKGGAVEGDYKHDADLHIPDGQDPIDNSKQ